ncbi:hypothetical protein B4110_2973 [Parageobacillus toebii]|uniref:Uncharacterized protein n=1 Tax=Parageobacillus toebii TaxID=153151 RepID=A0A150N5E5_9BACL|nr:hypothetical protein B4110_2973 [Parageobacillus toebii]
MASFFVFSIIQHKQKICCIQRYPTKRDEVLQKTLYITVFSK